MIGNRIDIEVNWNASIAKTLALLAMQQSDVREGSMLDKLGFLTRIGLPRSACAELLNTTTASLTEQERQARNRKKGHQNGKTIARQSAKR
jgi:hypothetical protein